MTTLKQLNENLKEQEIPHDEIEHFRILYKQFQEKKKGPNWKQISSPSEESIILYNSLKEPSVSRTKQLLKKLTVLRLNGGLGTSMGCVGPKSALEVRNGQSFLDIIVRQIQILNEKYDSNVPLVLMNSFNTDQDTKKIIKKYNGDLEILTFKQNRFPRLRRDSLLPMSRKKYGDEASYPPGHGDFYISFKKSGILDQLIAQGKEYLFIANADNLGASVDLNILNLMDESGTPFIMEATDRTRADIKGGTLVKTPKQSLRLLEIAQVPEEHLEEFKSFKKFKIFNTNNIWINLKELKNKLDQKALNLDVIVNKKTVQNIPIIQLETAIGAGMNSFEGSLSVKVPRTRFLPVKKTDDLLLIQSNLFILKDGVMVINPERQFSGLPLIRLGEKFQTVEQYQKRFQTIPDILELDLLTIVGDVYFGTRNILRGNVIVVCEQGELHLPDCSVLENKVLTGSIKMGDL